MSTPRRSLSNHPVTICVIRQAKAGAEAELEECIAKITTFSMQFPGHLGTSVFRQVTREGSTYRVIFKFDSARHLQLWQASPERQQWYERTRQFEREDPHVQVFEGLAAWLTLPEYQASSPPARYKMALLTWLGAFLTLTIVTFLLGPWVNPLPLVLRALILTGILVALLTWVLMPLLTHLFAWWLYPRLPRQKDDRQANASETGA